MWWSDSYDWEDVGLMKMCQLSHLLVVIYYVIDYLELCFKIASKETWHETLFETLDGNIYIIFIIKALWIIHVCVCVCVCVCVIILEGFIIFFIKVTKPLNFEEKICLDGGPPRYIVIYWKKFCLCGEVYLWLMI